MRLKAIYFYKRLSKEFHIYYGIWNISGISIAKIQSEPSRMEALSVLLRVSLQGLEPDREVPQRLTENYEPNIPTLLITK